MSRKELFEDALEKTNRIYELEELLSWTPDMMQTAIGLLDDGTPLNLHHIGMYRLDPVFHYLLVTNQQCF